MKNIEDHLMKLHALKRTLILYKMPVMADTVQDAIDLAENVQKREEKLDRLHAYLESGLTLDDVDPYHDDIEREDVFRSTVLKMSDTITEYLDDECNADESEVAKWYRRKYILPEVIGKSNE